MGFEIVYKYREALGQGEYGAEVNEKSTKLGQAFEDVPIEAVAAKVMAQLARRNILIVDVEIYEYAKKKISFKEAEDGILIKNKKFRFDDGPVVIESVGEEETSPENQLAALLAANPNLVNVVQQAVQPQASQPTHVAVPRLNAPAPAGKRAIRWEEFSPELLLEHKANQQKLKLTKGKKYPIFSEESLGHPPVTRTVYTIADDTGAHIQLGAEYFIPPISGKLIHENEMKANNGSSSEDVNLWGNYRGETIDAMPELRR